jgi:hypothetical protein
MEETDFPAIFQSADRSSLSAQQRFLQATKIRLGGLTLAAVCGAFDVTIGDVNPVVLVGVCFFVVAVGAEIFLLADRPDRAWYEGRAVAESVKTLTWRYAVGGIPFPLGMADADAHLLARFREFVPDLGDLRIDPVIRADHQITPAMRKLRSAEFDVRRRAYDEERIEDQRAWYAKKAQWNSGRAVIWSIVAVAGEMAGIVAGSLRAFEIINFDLFGILAAIAAGAAAWSQAKQYETLEHAYSTASQELAIIRSSVESVSEEKWATFVDDSEQAISREHTMWRAARSVSIRSDA